MTITVYYDLVSPPARSIINFLNVVNDTTVVRQLVSLAKKEQLEPWFLELNPHHTVPVLKDDENGIVLFESTAILQYLAETLGVKGKFGLPTDTKAKWVTINALHNQSNFVSKASMDIMSNIYAAWFGGQKLDLDKLKAGVETAKPKLAILDEILTQRGGFIGGEQPTIADVRAWTDLFQLSNLGGKATWEIVDFEKLGFKSIQKWLLAVKEDIYTEEDWKSWAGAYAYAASVLGNEDFRLEKKD